MIPETSPPILASLKSAKRAVLKSQTAPSYPFRGKDEHTGISERVNSFLNYFSNFFQKTFFRGEIGLFFDGIDEKADGMNGIF